ncbi:hypothetical protein GCM10027261_43210 [Geodermatophilus arenarius]|uniref:histidine kinase n=1 Tax=Geodermatophilus arenarius TaxID=1137990 RepID=A0ABV9LNY8_9ACTN
MSTGNSGIVAAGAHRTRRVLTAGRATALAAAAGALVLLRPEARHTALVVLGALALCAAGGCFLLRWRVTGTSDSGRVGTGLALLGLRVPAVVVVEDLLVDGGLLAPAVLAPLMSLAVVLAAAGVTLRAFADGRRARRTTAVATVVGLAGAVVVTVVPDGRVPGLLGSAAAAAALWTAVCVAAWRRRAVAAGVSARTLTGVAAVVAVLTPVQVVPALAPGLAGIATVTGDLGLVAVGLLCAGTALVRLTDALAGQERYVAGLVGQLAGHEHQLQQARACLHDARAAVAGVRAGNSAARYATGADRADLEESVAVELRRLERMLRLPDRTPTVRPVEVDAVLRALVVAHRERGLRVSWAPSGCAPVAADGDALAVIVGNLLGNALEHAPGALCRVTVSRTGTELRVVVDDDGPGLDAAQRAGVFEAGTRRAGSPGEGLGLTISRDLARRHGGDLVLADGPAGARFEVTLPATSLPVPVARLVPAPRSGAEPLPTGAR